MIPRTPTKGPGPFSTIIGDKDKVTSKHGQRIPRPPRGPHQLHVAQGRAVPAGTYPPAPGRPSSRRPACAALHRRVLPRPASGKPPHLHLHPQTPEQAQRLLRTPTFGDTYPTPCCLLQLTHQITRKAATVPWGRPDERLWDQHVGCTTRPATAARELTAV